MINPYVDNLIADKINQNLIRKKIAFIYRIDNELLNDFFLQSLEHHLYSQSEEPLSSIFFNVYGSLETEILNNTDLLTKDSVLEGAIPQLKNKIFILNFQTRQAISMQENLKMMGLMLQSDCYFLVLLPNDFKTRDIADGVSLDSNLIENFTNYSINVPSPSQTGKYEFVAAKLAFLGVSIDEKAKNTLQQELLDRKVRFSHIANYIIFLEGHDLIKNKDIEVLTEDLLPVFGSVGDAFQNLGDRFLEEVNLKFPDLNIESVFRFFLRKEKDEIITSMKFTRTEILENFTDVSQIEAFIDLALTPKYRILLIEDKDEWEGENLIEICHDFLIYWQWFEHIVTLERMEANLYLKFVELAETFNSKNGSLLNAEQVLESSVLLDSENFTATWAKKYASQFELTKNFILDSRDHLEKTKSSEERKRAVQLRRARRTVLVVGGALIISMILLLVSFGFYKNAQEAQISESSAKSIAEQKAIEAQRNADLAAESTKAAEKSAINARQSLKIAEEQKAIAQYNAEIAAKNAKIAEQNALIAAQKEADARASEESALQSKLQAEKNEKEANYQKELAEQKTNQQIARSAAIQAMQLYENGEYQKGFELAKDAFNENKHNNGNLFDKDIILSLIKGYSLLHQPSISSQQDIKKIGYSEENNVMAYLTLDQQIIFYNIEQSNKIQSFSAEDLLDFYLLGNDKVMLIFNQNTPQIYDIKSQQTRNMNALPTAITSVFPLPGTDTFLLTSDQSLELFNMKDFSVKPIYTGKQLNNIVRWNQNTFICSIDGNKLGSFSLNAGVFSPEVEIINTFPDKISSISNVFEDNKLGVGLYNGSLNLVNLTNNQIIFSNQVHKSKITSCHGKALENKTALVSTGLDSEIHVFYGYQKEWEAQSYTSIGNISTHTQWITGSIFDNQSSSLITASADRTLKFWPINPSTIINFQ